MPQYTQLQEMFDAVAAHVRKHKNEVFWDDDTQARIYQVTDTALHTTWGISARNALAPGQGGNERTWVLREALKTAKGKENILRSLNALRFEPPPASVPTAWERILSDD